MISNAKPLCSAFLMIAMAGEVCPAQSDRPRVEDPRLRLQLVAEDPDIVTPIGLAIDAKDQLFVLESHTHQRPADYDGPSSDRVKRFADHDGDGTYEDVTVFADGIQTGMNLAFSPDGLLHVVCAMEVLALPDEDNDGRCDGARSILRLESQSRYAHSALLGITFDREGRMYVSRGNLGSRAWRIEGRDGSRIEGYGDGGSILRCRPDGAEVESFAVGFWNPFEIKFDTRGRLLCVDNDPDARGPNRLLHIVRGGDYGHRLIYGGGGNHPFQGWDGDLPGTLPMVGGTGEAPCDLIDCRLSSLPTDYADSVLVTVWNENTIQRHRIEPHGSSIVSSADVLVSGGDDFRPVAIEADRRGNLFFTDWMLVDYPNHGRGRVWKLSTADAKETLTPRSYFAEPLSGSGAPMIRDDPASLRTVLASEDPFERHAAVLALADNGSRATIESMLSDHEALVRLGGLLAASRRTDLSPRWRQDVAARMFSDADAVVRRAALIWAGTAGMKQLRRDIDRAIENIDVTDVLFETYLAANESLDPEFVQAVRDRSEAVAKSIPRSIESGLLQRIASDASRSARLRSLAAKHFDDPLSPEIRSMLSKWAVSEEPILKLSAVQILSRRPDAATRDLLMSLATDDRESDAVRCEALLAISRDASVDAKAIVPLLSESSDSVVIAAARALKEFASQTRTVAAAAELVDATFPPAAVEAIEFASGGRPSRRGETIEQWQTLLATGGDPQAGRRVFLSGAATCSNCHTIGGRGAALGPDLSHLSQSVDRQQVIRSVLLPSEQYAPQYQAWMVLTDDGRIHTGLQLDHRKGGAINMLTIDGTIRHFEADEIEEYSVSKKSVMPDGLEKSLTTSELLDLISFLTADR